MNIFGQNVLPLSLKAALQVPLEAMLPCGAVGTVVAAVCVACLCKPQCVGFGAGVAIVA